MNTHESYLEIEFNFPDNAVGVIANGANVRIMNNGKMALLSSIGGKTNEHIVDYHTALFRYKLLTSNENEYGSVLLDLK